MTDAARPLSPFDFRPDFTAPPPAEAGEVRLSAEEVVALISKVRSDALAEVSRQEAQETLDRLDRVTSTMRDVLSDLLKMMQIIDSAAYDTGTNAQLRSTVTGLAQRLLDGQGDLFGLTRDLSEKLDNAPSGGRRMGQ
ncbi:MAG: hypothetical protein CVT79_08350 [Alphaproteobacteria bacterium HGW-Alphaproteobacteria-18]|nr:MAG: hypothetical protein CVT79_08350 [Alphaproteobacteria bacterium HGW-Alphaproteobacteria-18]